MNLIKQIFDEQEFEKVWVNKKIRCNTNATNHLSDEDYISFKIWEDYNAKRMHKKYLSNVVLFRGKNPNIIFHGGCLGCISQKNFGINRCKGCFYFRNNRNEPNLYIEQ